LQVGIFSGLNFTRDLVKQRPGQEEPANKEEVMTAPYDLRKLKEKFDSDGYAVVPGFLSALDLDEVNNELDRYITYRLPELPRTDVYFENLGDPSTLKQMARIKQHDSFFASLILRSQWTEVAEALLADQAVPQELEWFNKPPRIGKPTPPHQDGYYFMLEPNEAATMWLALDPVDESNGCVRYIPGSHRKGLRPHGRTEVLGFSQGITDYGTADRNAEIPILAQPGDLLVHHALTIHRADGNPSPRHRRSLGLIYYAERARQDTEKLAAYQKQLNAELQGSKQI
jgi:phytanoyl-CoA hydroxylase